ncbi:MAG: transposase [Acutalibacteraceae bacterium]
MNPPNRKPNRLKGYDYSENGVYFITICVQNKEHILSKIVVGEGSPLPKLTAYGQIVDKNIRQINERYPTVFVEKYVVMPNHIHLLAEIYGEPFGTGDPSPTINSVIAWMKYQTAKQINAMRKTPGVRVWQRSFYDHIVRGQQDYDEIWQYIDENPIRWSKDCFY